MKTPAESSLLIYVNALYNDDTLTKYQWSRLSEKINDYKNEKEAAVKTFEEAWEHYQEHAVPPLMTEEEFREVFDMITSVQPEKPSGVPHTLKGKSTL